MTYKVNAVMFCMFEKLIITTCEHFCVNVKTVTSVRSVLTCTASEQSMMGTRAMNVDIIRNVTYK